MVMIVEFVNKYSEREFVDSPAQEKIVIEIVLLVKIWARLSVVDSCSIERLF
jgi:hypothetical protein